MAAARREAPVRPAVPAARPATAAIRAEQRRRRHSERLVAEWLRTLAARRR
jgi:hypothetical protein